VVASKVIGSIAERSTHLLHGTHDAVIAGVGVVNAEPAGVSARTFIVHIASVLALMSGAVKAQFVYLPTESLVIPVAQAYAHESLSAGVFPAPSFSCFGVKPVVLAGNVFKYSIASAVVSSTA